MPVEDMAVVTVEIAVATADTVADMPRPPMLEADMLAMSKLHTLFAAGVDRTEGWCGERGEHAWVGGDGGRDALATGQPGADELVGVAR